MSIRERILAMGPPSSGKSYQWLKIAKTLLPTGAEFYVIDTDDAITYMTEYQFPELLPRNGGNVHVLPAYGWEQYEEGLETVLKKGREQDWVVIDMADNAWETVQRHFIDQVFGKSKGHYFLEARKAIQARGGRSSSGKAITALSEDTLKGWMDWPVVNALYSDWILPIVYQCKSHVYVTTKVQKLSTKEDVGNLVLFSDIGVRPAGQKNLGHQVHTIFLFTVNLSAPHDPQWAITTIKDRGNRTYFTRTPLHDLFKQYLMVKAGWELPKVKTE